MGLAEIYQNGEKNLREKEIGWLLDGVETGFIFEHDRKILDHYTFRPRYIDGVNPDTACSVLGIDLATPVIMSAMTMPIPAIAEDGLLKVAQGLKAAGIVVSNHGAHTLDYLPHPLQVMDEIVTAVGDQLVIIVDGGFRRGSDVLKALAFGGTLVGLGRPILYGLGADGQEGVKQVISEITGEMRRIMSMLGAVHPGDLSKELIIEN